MSKMSIWQFRIIQIVFHISEIRFLFLIVKRHLFFFHLITYSQTTKICRN